MRLIDLRPERLVCQDIVDPIIRIAQPSIVGPTVSLRIRQQNLLQAIRTLPWTEDLLNRRLILGVIEIAIDQQVRGSDPWSTPVDMLSQQPSLVTPQKRLSRGSRQLGFQMGAHHSQPKCWIYFDCDIEKSAFDRFPLAVQVKEKIFFRVALYDFESTEQRQMPIPIRTADVLGERKFKTGFLETLLKLLELIGRPHLGDAEDIRMNFFDDPDQTYSFRVRV